MELASFQHLSAKTNGGDHDSARIKELEEALTTQQHQNNNEVCQGGLGETY